MKSSSTTRPLTCGDARKGDVPLERGHSTCHDPEVSDEQQLPEDDHPPVAGRIFWPQDHPLLRGAPQVANSVGIQTEATADGGALAYLVVTLGHAMNPVLAGNAEQQYETARAMAEESGGTLLVPIAPVARFALTPGTARHLRDTLNEVLAAAGQQEVSDESGD